MQQQQHELLQQLPHQHYQQQWPHALLRAGRQLLQQQQQQAQTQLQPQQEQHAPRVMGVGVGVFLLGLFLVVCLVMALLGSRTTKPGLSYTVCTALYGVILLVLVASPKGSAPLPSTVGYDMSIVPLVATIASVSVAAVCSLVGMLVFQARATIYARRLSYHADVMHQQ